RCRSGVDGAGDALESALALARSGDPGRKGARASAVLALGAARRSQRHCKCEARHALDRMRPSAPALVVAPVRAGHAGGKCARETTSAPETTEQVIGENVDWNQAQRLLHRRLPFAATSA